MSTESIQQDGEKSGFRSLLAKRDYTRLWFGQVVSNIGTAISFLALLFFAYALTNSAMAIAILSILRTIPVLLFSSIAGVYADRWNRKTIMILSDVTRAFFILLIPLSIYFPQQIPTIYWVYLFTFLYASCDVWFYPSRNAAIPRLVEKNELVAANSLSQMTFQVVQLTVPPLGGVLVAMLAPDYFFAFALNALTFIISGIALSGIRTNLKPQDSNLAKPKMLTEIKEGASVAVGNPIILYIFVFMMLVAGSSGIINALIAPHLMGTLSFTEADLGLMMGAGAGVGAATAFLMGNRTKLSKPLLLITSAAVIAGIAIIGFALSIEFLGIILSWCLIGSVDVLINIPSSTLMQELVEDRMRGRIFSLLSIVFTSVQVIGMGIGGIWAEFGGSTVPPLFLSGIVLILVAIAGFLVITRKQLHAQLEIMLLSDEELDIDTFPDEEDEIIDSWQVI